MTDNLYSNSEYNAEPDLDLDAKIQLLAGKLSAANRIVFLTGAGVSTDSGIPDFRSSTGIYQMTSEDLFRIDRFLANTEWFYSIFGNFYAGIADAKPNTGHLAIAELEKRCGKLIDVVTQNIDALHSSAGSTSVAEVHGTLRTASCLKCAKQYSQDYFEPDMRSGRVPRCSCGGALKPDVTFFGEMLPEHAFVQARSAMKEAELLVVVGTSLQVTPAALLPRECPADTPFVIINKTPTYLDSEAALVFYESIGDVLPQAVSLVKSA